MADHGLPVLYALFLWWFSTGLILYLDGLPRRTFRWSMLGRHGAALASPLRALAASSGRHRVGGAYLAFTCGLLIWGWHEMSFLMGFVTGPRRERLPRRLPRLAPLRPRDRGHPLPRARDRWRPALVVVALTWGGANQVGTWTFMVLWVMRLSAKLNVFLGVPNLTDEFLPEHLQYLKSFFTQEADEPAVPGLGDRWRPSSPLLVVQAAWRPRRSAFDADGVHLRSATLLALAILEHWFLVLPRRCRALELGAALAQHRSRARRLRLHRHAMPLPTYADLPAPTGGDDELRSLLPVPARRPSPRRPLPRVRRSRAACRRLSRAPPITATATAPR